MLRIEVYVNRTRVASASATNVRGDAISDYVCSAVTWANPFTGSDRRTDGFELRRHRRAQSVWRLVAKMALRLARNDESRDRYLARRAAQQANVLSPGGDHADTHV